jgi:hypothetical protein
MLMPETPVYKDNDSVLRENDVRCTRKGLNVLTETKPERKKDPPYLNFRGSVFARDARHYGTTAAVDSHVYNAFASASAESMP